jgi:GxxExxY protein
MLRHPLREASGMQAINDVTEAIIGAAIAVHRELGPGLLESAYERCLAFELAECGYAVECQKPQPIVYKGIRLDCGYRIDLLVSGLVVVELKTVDQFSAVDEAQLLSYLKLSGCPAGLLINFKVRLLKQGVRRFLGGTTFAPPAV